MVSLLFTVGGDVVNFSPLAALILSSIGSQIMVKKNKKDMIWHLKGSKVHEMNGIRIDWNGLILSTKDYEARACINNINETLLKYCRVFAKQTKTLLPEPQLSDFYYPSEAQESGELLFGAVGTDIATYALNKYLK